MLSCYHKLSPITGIAVHLLPTFTLITSCHLFHKLSPYHKLYLLRCRPYHNCPLSQAVHYHKPSPLTQAVPLSQALPLEHTVTPIKAVTLIICPRITINPLYLCNKLSFLLTSHSLITSCHPYHKQQNSHDDSFCRHPYHRLSLCHKPYLVSCHIYHRLSTYYRAVHYHKPSPL